VRNADAQAMVIDHRFTNVKGEKTMASPQNYPYPKYNFLVEIYGLALAGFLECTGLESETAVIEYREGSWPSSVRKIPGLTKYTNITLKRGVTTSTELYDWRANIINGQIDRRNGSIVLLDEKRQEVARWNFREGWPCRMSGPDLNALKNAVAIEELVICHEGFERLV
jgi:phage tail-like protein